MSTESEESSGLVDFLVWLETNKQKIMVGGVGVLAIASVVYIFQWQGEQKEQAAGEALYEVQLKEAETEESDQPKAADYLSVVSDFSGTTAAERALLLAARSHFLADEYDEARALFDQFQAEFGDSDFVASALYGIAACHDAAGSLSEAKGAFQAVLNRFPNTPVASQAKLAMASIHESLDEVAEALALYDDLNRPGVPLSYSSRAMARREALFMRHPELRPEPEVTVDAVEASEEGSDGATTETTDSAEESSSAEE